jgi:hypothetical protein
MIEARRILKHLPMSCTGACGEFAADCTFDEDVIALKEALGICPGGDNVVPAVKGGKVLSGEESLLLSHCSLCKVRWGEHP